MATLEKPVFVCDPSFCPSCGLILPLPGLRPSISCELCGYEQSTEVYEDQVEYTVKYYSVDKKKNKKECVKRQDIDSGPMVERKCPRCGNEKMMYATQQTRSADEGQTVFYTCPSCMFKETENS